MLVTPTKKSADMLLELLRGCWDSPPERVLVASSCNEGRRHLIDNAFDLVLINAPLTDEFGHEFAAHVCQSSTAGVLMLVKSDLADTVSEQVENDGVFVVPKPISRSAFYQAIRLVNACRLRVYQLQAENRRLRQRLEDLRVIDRAKCLLIEFNRMSESNAHAHIEKEAMNRRLTKRDVAEEILRRY